MSPHPQHQNKNDFSWNHFTFIAFFKKKKTFKSRDGIKGKNSISQQAALLSEHSRVCAKKAWDIKNKTKTNKRLPTALEQKHSSCTSSIHGLEFLAYTFNKECRSGWRTSLSFNISAPSIHTNVVLESHKMCAVWKFNKVACLLRVYWPGTEHNASA